MKRLAFWLLSLCTIVAWASPGFALDPSFIVNNLPREFTGTFQWESGGTPSKVVIHLHAVTTGSKGTIKANGKGEYHDAEGVARIGIECTIDASTLQFEMLERGPSDGWVDGGSHVGRISADLRSITATWTTRSTGKRGTLTLNAE